MRSYLSMFLIACLLASTVGCGNSEPTPVGQSGSQAASSQAVTPQSNTQAASRSSDATIKQVAHDFLEAIRTGNSAAASAKLTPTAQQVMRQQDMGFELLASNTATFQVDAVDHVEANEVGVNSVWTELDEQGKPIKEHWTLGLQQINGNWCVRGIIADMGSNQPPMMMDFENPDQPATPTSPSTPANTAGTASPINTVPQQATRPVAQDPFRQ